MKGNATKWRRRVDLQQGSMADKGQARVSVAELGYGGYKNQLTGN